MRTLQVLQSKTGVESVAFVLDKGLAQGHFTLQSIHGTFITPGQNSVGALRREDRHAMWKLSMGTGGTICLEGAGKGQYLWALEDRESVTMMPLCIEHSLLHPSTSPSFLPITLTLQFCTCTKHRRHGEPLHHIQKSQFPCSLRNSMRGQCLVFASSRKCFRQSC